MIKEPMMGGMPEKEAQRINDFHEGGAKKVFSERANAKTAEHGLVFDEQGKANLTGAKLAELIDTGVLAEPVFHDEDPESPMPHLHKEEFINLGNIELELFWDCCHFRLPIVPEEISELDPEATDSNWVAYVNMSKSEKDEMWYETRLHLGWTQDEVKKARKKGIHPHSPNASEMQE